MFGKWLSSSFFIKLSRFCVFILKLRFDFLASLCKGCSPGRVMINGEEKGVTYNGGVHIGLNYRSKRNKRLNKLKVYP